MSETKFTAGPWKAFWAKGNTHLLVGIGSADTGEGVADSRNGLWGGDSEEARANAALIAAAPELYGALSEAESALFFALADLGASLAIIEAIKGEGTALGLRQTLERVATAHVAAKSALRKARGDQ